MEKLQQIFEKAHNEIKLKNVNGFYLTIKKLFDNLSCDCFLIDLRDQKKELLEEQLSLIENIPDDFENYELNVSKGYLYLLNRNEETAFKYLNQAIELNKNDYLPYVLRSNLTSRINSNYLSDAIRAEHLNPSSRNNFLLAQAISRDNIFIPEKHSIYINDLPRFDWLTAQNSIKYLNTAIELNQNFVHAFYERGKIYWGLKDYKNAIIDFKYCIHLESLDYGYYNVITECLVEQARSLDNFTKGMLQQEIYKDALFYALEGFKQSPTLLFNHKIIGDIYSEMFDYLKAIYHYEKYLEKYPGNEEVKISLDECKNLSLEKEKRETAKKAYEQCDYYTFISIIEEKIDIKLIDNELSILYNFNDWYLFNFDINMYLLALILKDGKNIQIDETNPIFIELNKLKESSELKLDEGLKLSNDEENIGKLIAYQINFKFGFGKYENQTINEIIKLNPHYILWCIVNLKHFAINDCILASPEFRNQPLLIAAIENNLIKNMIIEKWQFEKDDDEYYDNDDEYYSYKNHEYTDPSEARGSFYNDELDMDQQSPEFWDNI